MSKQLKINKMKYLRSKMIRQLMCASAILLMVVSCNTNSTKDKPYLVQYTDQLISQYPNYASNKIAESALMDSIKNHAKSFIGKPAKDLEGLEFEFCKLIEGEKGYCAVFKGGGLSMIDAPKGSTQKSIVTTSYIIAFGNVDNSMAAKLDKKKKYSVSGLLHSWDGTYSLGIYPKILSDDLYYGTYILDNMTISEIP